MNSKKIAIFASGSGSNAENIYTYFKQHPEISVERIVCNRKTAGVIERFKNTEVRVAIITKSDLGNTDFVESLKDIDLIILAGFLVLIPSVFISHFEDKIINIHPSLLPKYGGEGMYGDRVHEAVLAHHESESGITIHYVNEQYDKGEIIFQAKVEIIPEDTIDTLKDKIHALEHEFYPIVIENLLS